ncbi:hypothetical protein VDGE_10057 [Verticillium dahliae]|uniref:Ubiquitin-like protein ATG12 n=1 Tax=Verticillium dahliae TaxID=27337 RepID=A0A444RLH9_VERDA|nr:hypothetical protein VDGE_10057 [Verticillium dahliae]
MSSPAQQSPPASPPDSPIPDRTTSPDIPLTMSASAILTAQPRDVTAALASAGLFPNDKVVVSFKPIGSAPSLARSVFKISADQKFENIVQHLRKKLKVQSTDSVFCYVNSAFAPSLDEVVGNLHGCFKDMSDQLLASRSYGSPHATSTLEMENKPGLQRFCILLFQSKPP